MITMNEQIRTQLKDFLESESKKGKHGEDYVSQAALGKALGFTSGSPLSQYLKGAWRGNIPELEEKLANYFSFAGKKEAFAEKPRQLRPIDRFAYVPTSISQGIYNDIEYCRLMKGIAVLHGDAGIGKTMAAMKYIRDNKGFAVYIKIQEGCLSRRDIFISIATKLGIKDAKNARERFRLIKESLNKSDKVIILDEAHRLPAKSLEFLRDLSDEEMDEDGNVFYGAGLVLMGNSNVSDFLDNLKRKDMEQCRSRTIWEQCFLRKQTTLEDIKLVFPYLRDNGMDAELDALLKVGRDQARGLRGAIIIYNNAVNHGDVSLEGLIKICKSSHIGKIGGDTK